MSAYQTFPWTRPVRIGLEALNAALRATDATAAVVRIGIDNVVTLKKSTPWTDAQIVATQAVLDTAVEPTAQVRAQRQVDALPLEFRALVLALIDQLNVVRAALPVPLPPITAGQAIAAIRAKAATL